MDQDDRGSIFRIVAKGIATTMLAAPVTGDAAFHGLKAQAHNHFLFEEFRLLPTYRPIRPVNLEQLAQSAKSFPAKPAKPAIRKDVPTGGDLRHLPVLGLRLR
ncbi:hypothetical protein [Lignipirellula cremea]|uniref:hypothetical protein n=1 Tax=Lignipirellula cremea TaxID=2528010 RepID=UPI0011A22639|nr:hypothetical protein [Lignipirellula cremea]